MAEEEEAWFNWRLMLIEKIILFWDWLHYRASEMIFQTRFEYTRDLTRFGRTDVIRVFGGKGIKTKCGGGSLA